jgi:hypothetical protein
LLQSGQAPRETPAPDVSSNSEIGFETNTALTTALLTDLF